MAETSTLARPYAKAAFEYALAAGDIGGWSTQLKLLAAVAGTDNLQSILGTPSLTSEQQAAALIGVCGDALSDKLRNFVGVLAQNKRLPLLAHISQLFEIMRANHEARVDVEVASAYPLGDALEQQLAKALKDKLQREVIITTVVDKDLLGGVRVRAGDVVIDGSVRGRLAKLAEALHA
ncbi:MAG TPA: F0F1 ATP synthase subunit delta [Spongiibacteraceae bacterium]|jgi:F-type H+-transporting ATPase subunit delta|nr:F0F1 ATP synthase subunit delta [Spongiibacteraceae bacterium]HUH36384.1 F0F1 ATP synthase subunit delta [Spongiibacteraceae bacterium]